MTSVDLDSLPVNLPSRQRLRLHPLATLATPVNPPISTDQPTVRKTCCIAATPTPELSIVMEPDQSLLRLPNHRVPKLNR